MTVRLEASEQAIASAVSNVAERLNRGYAGKDPVLLGILTGGFVFTADLCRRLTIQHEVDFIKMSCCGDGQEAGEPEWVLRPSIDLNHRHVLLVDDIIDTGRTADRVMNDLRMQYRLKSIALCALLSKMAHRERTVFVPYVGIAVDDVFVYGYGLDRAGRDRHLKEIYSDGAQEL